MSSDPNAGWTPDTLWPVKNLDPMLVQLHDILVECNALEKFRVAVQSVIDQKIVDIAGPESEGGLGIKTPLDYIQFMHDFLHWVPTEQKDGQWIYKHICGVYFVFNQPSLYDDHSLQNPIDPTQVRKPLKPLSVWQIKYAKQLGNFLDQPASWGQPGQLQSFKDAARFNIDRYVIPDWPNATFNDFFCRRLKTPNPIQGEDDPSIVVSPADCLYASYVQPIEDDNIINLKSLLWRVQDLLFPSDWQSVFKGGSFVHAFLGPADYHRKHMPVKGKVVYARVVQGQCYLEVTTQEDKHGKRRLVPVRPIAPFHPTRAKFAKGDDEHLDAQDSAGYQFQQTRGVVIVDTEDPRIGHVAVIPVGMAQVSSVNLSVYEGNSVKKGDEMSYFLFGGSDIIMVFEKKAGFKLDEAIVEQIRLAEEKHETVQYPHNHFTQGQRIGTFNFHQ